MKKYKLFDEFNYCIATLSLTNEDWFEGEIIEHTAWQEEDKIYHEGDLYVASFIIKFDLCSHWNFVGEDYLKEKSNDSYYHICGAYSYINMALYMWFAVKCAEMFYKSKDKYYEKEEYNIVFNTFKDISKDYVIKEIGDEEER